MVVDMTFGPMAIDWSLFQDIMILMKNLLDQFYVKQKKEFNNEIFREDI